MAEDTWDWTGNNQLMADNTRGVTMSDRQNESLRGLRGLVRRVLHRSDAQMPPSQVDEPCLACGDETAVGSPLFPERHDFDLEDGSRAHLCGECYAKARAAKGGQDLTTKDINSIANNGLMIGAGFFTGH